MGSPRALEGVGSPAPADGCSRPLSPCSTELMRRLRRFQIAQYKCLVIKYAKDTRYSDSFCTHDRSVPALLPCPRFRGAHPEHAVRALSWGGAIRRMPGTELAAWQTSWAAWQACLARGLLLDSSRVIFAGTILPPPSIWQCLEFVVFIARGGGACLWHPVSGGQGCCPASCNVPVAPPNPVRSSPAPAFTAVQRSRTGSLSPPVLSTGATSSEAVPCHMQGSRLRGGSGGGPEAGLGVGWGGRRRGLAARCWELESRSRLCYLRLPVRFLIPEMWCPLHRAGTHWEDSESRQHGAVIRSLCGVGQSRVKPGPGQVPQSRLTRAVGSCGASDRDRVLSRSDKTPETLPLLKL